MYVFARFGKVFSVPVGTEKVKAESHTPQKRMCSLKKKIAQQKNKSSIEEVINIFLTFHIYFFYILHFNYQILEKSFINRCQYFSPV